MCMFTFPNRASKRALSKGIKKFECGACPECLQKKSRLWALRCGMEARSNVGMMITLTYDTHKVVNGRELMEENPVDTSLTVSKEHAQRFIKRLRKHFPDKNIKYLLTAEYGKRTHRAHYHALIFGVQFNDLRFYKQSKRGNIIYKSPTLEAIWSADKEHNGGICTVDCCNLSAKVARYCTKYCAKDSGIDDTFMLFSRGIGDDELMKNFDGKSYWIDGREYSIPRQVWQKYIEKKYGLLGFSRYVGHKKTLPFEKSLCNKFDNLEKRYPVLCSKRDKVVARIYRLLQSVPCKRGFRSQSTFLRYKEREKKLCSLLDMIEVDIDKNRSLYERTREFSFCSFFGDNITYERAKFKREVYQIARDSDFVYSRYLDYWQSKAETFEKYRADDLTRILQLPDDKYRSYKSKAILCKLKQARFIDFVPPRSNSQGFVKVKQKIIHFNERFAPLSRHYWANDTKDCKYFAIFGNYLKKSVKLIFYDVLSPDENPFFDDILRKMKKY